MFWVYAGTRIGILGGGDLALSCVHVCGCVCVIAPPPSSPWEKGQGISVEVRVAPAEAMNESGQTFTACPKVQSSSEVQI